jgi:hypothetical protein
VKTEQKEIHTIDDVGVAVHAVFGVSAVLLGYVLVPKLGVIGDTLAVAAVDHAFAGVLD